MGDAGVDDRFGFQFHHPADVDSGGGPGEVEGRNLEVGIRSDRDLSHPRGRAERILRGAEPDKPHHRGSRDHGHAAKAHCFDNGAVPHVRVGIGGAVAREVQAVRHRRRGGEPGRAQPADAEAELHPVAAHRRDDGAVRNVPQTIGDGFACCHRHVEEELIVVGQEAQDLRDGRRRQGRAGQHRRQRADGQRGGRDVALMHLIPHRQRPRHQRHQRQPPE